MFLSNSLLGKFGTIIFKDNLDNKLSKTHIVIGGDHGQRDFHSFGKFIIREKEVYN